MKAAVVYTVLSLADLLAFFIGVLCLPELVPVHFDAGMRVDALGSPWSLVGLPAASALLSAAIWICVLVQKKNRALTCAIFTFMGIVFSVLGWTFFGLAASGMQLGEKTDFPIGLVTALPLSLLLAWLGNYLPRVEPNRLIGIRTPATLASEEVWRKTHRLGGYLLFAAGVLSAAATILLSCFVSNAPLLSAAVLAGTTLFCVAAVCIYAHVLRKKETSEEGSAPREGD